MLNENEKRQMLALWENGVPMEQIYQMMPCTRYEAIKAVRELRKEGLMLSRNKQELAIEKVALAWLTETKDIDELAEMFGYSCLTVKRYLNKSGVRKNKHYNHKPKTPERVNAIIADLQNGMRVCDITWKYAVSRQYVYQLKGKGNTE